MTEKRDNQRKLTGVTIQTPFSSIIIYKGPQKRSPIIEIQINSECLLQSKQINICLQVLSQCHSLLSKFSVGHRNQVSWSGFFYFDTIFLELGFRSVLVNVSVKFVSVDRSYTFRIQIETFFSIIVINEISGTDRVISKRTFSQVRKC